MWDLRHFKRQSHEVHVVECRREFDTCAAALHAFFAHGVSEPAPASASISRTAEE